MSAANKNYFPLCPSDVSAANKNSSSLCPPHLSAANKKLDFLNSAKGLIMIRKLGGPVKVLKDACSRPINITRKSENELKALLKIYRSQNPKYTKLPEQPVQCLSCLQIFSREHFSYRHRKECRKRSAVDSSPSNSKPVFTPPISSSKESAPEVESPKGWKTIGHFKNVVKDCIYLDECRKMKRSHGWTNCFRVPPDPLMMSSPVLDDFLCHPTFFWWPEFFFPRFVSSMPCPSSDCSGETTYEGWNKNGPRLSSSHSPFWVICKSYKCKKCGRCFQGYDEGCLKKLPECIQLKLPVVVTGKLCVDRVWSDIVSRQFCNGQSFSDARKLLEEVAHLTYYRTSLQFYESLVQLKNGIIGSTVQVSPFPPPTPGKGEGFPLSIPSAVSLKKIWHLKAVEVKPQIVKSVQEQKGKILCGDETFKVAKIPHQSYSKVFDGLYTVMNEYGVIVGFYLMTSQSLNEIAPDLRKISSRYGNGEGPFLFYTDKCCSDRNTLERYIPELICQKSEPQRVLLDSFHWMNRFEVSKKHPLYALFIRALRDALFVVNPDDLEKLHSILKAKGYSMDEIKLIQSDYYSKVRRRIPEPDVLEKRVKWVLLFFHQVDDTFLPKGMLEKNLHHVKAGCLSDHPEVNLYLEYEEQAELVQRKLRIARGTNQLESFHNWIANATSSKMLSVETFNVQLHHLVYRWNVDRATKANILPNLKCYDIRLLEKLHSVCEKNFNILQHRFLPPSYKPIVCTPTDELERFGSDKIANSTLMDSYLNLDEDPEDMEGDNESEIDMKEDEEEDTFDDDFDEALIDDEFPVPNEPLDELITADEETEVPKVVNLEYNPPKPSWNLKLKLRHQKCLPFQTQEEADLFVVLYKELFSDCKVSYSKFAIHWNTKVMELVQKSEDSRSVFSKYRFKTESYLRDFKEKLESRHLCSKKLDGFWEHLRDMQLELRSTDKAPSNQPIPLFLNEVIPDDPPECHGPEVNSTVVANHTAVAISNPLDELREEYGRELVDFVMNPSVKMCKTCWKPRSINGRSAFSHGKNGCPNQPIVGRNWNSLYKCVKRAMKANLSFSTTENQPIQSKEENQPIQSAKEKIQPIHNASKEDVLGKRSAIPSPSRNEIAWGKKPAINVEEEDILMMSTQELRLSERISVVVDEEDIIELHQEPCCSKSLPRFYVPDNISLIIEAGFAADPSEVLALCNNNPISSEDLVLLKPERWVSDEIINFYFNLIWERSKNVPSLPRVFVLSSQLWPRLQADFSVGYEVVKRYSNRVNHMENIKTIFDLDLLLIPIHLRNHWTLVAVNFQEKTIDYLDSFHKDNQTCLEIFSKYLEMESLSKRNLPFDRNGWKLNNLKNIPFQQNAVDCGVFCCAFAEFLSRNAPLDFRQKDMIDLRKLMAYEILSCRLMDRK